MDSEKSFLPRRLVVRSVCAFFAAILLYPLSFGPVNYVTARYRGPAEPYFPLIEAIYTPLEDMVANTPLERPFVAYYMWWFQLGRPKGQNYYGN